MQINSSLFELSKAVKILQSYVNTDKVETIPKTFFEEAAKAIAIDEEKCHLYDNAAESRLEFSEPITNLFNRVTDKFNLGQLDILEMGAGLFGPNAITGKNESYLSSKLPHRSWIFSDLHPKTTRIKDTKQYTQLDLLKTTSKINASFDSIVGCNVLDTLPYEKLTDAFRNISRALKPNGVCIHFADLNFLGNSFFQAVSNQNKDCIFLPTKDRINSVYKISRLDFQRILKEKSQSLSSLELSMLDYWGKQKSFLQALTVWKYSDHELLGHDHLLLIDRIEDIFASNLQEISSHQVFMKSLTEAATKNDFSIEMCEDVYGILEKRVQSPINPNYFVSNQKFAYQFKSYALAPDLSVTKVQAHVFIAKKIDKVI